jgi:hypothetical protein
MIFKKNGQMKHIILAILMLSLLSLISCQPAAEKEKTTEQPPFDTAAYLAKGDQISSSVFGTLSAEVGKSMKANGVEATISYCNVHAYPITDSLAAIHQAKIKRTSHKVRNLNNAPDSLESAILEQYTSLQQQGLEMPSQVVQEGGNVRFFAPILLAQPCLKCHGIVGETLDENDLAVIQQYYPEDKATGFAAGELRGIWSIQF